MLETSSSEFASSSVWFRWSSLKYTGVIDVISFGDLCYLQIKIDLNHANVRFISGELYTMHWFVFQ